MKTLKIIMLALIVAVGANAQTALFAPKAPTPITANDFIAKSSCANMACVHDFFIARGYTATAVGESYTFSPIKTTPANAGDSFNAEVFSSKNTFSFSTPNKATYDALMQGFAALGFVSAKGDAAQTGGNFESPQHVNHKLSTIVRTNGTALYMILLTYTK